MSKQPKPSLKSIIASSVASAPSSPEVVPFKAAASGRRVPEPASQITSKATLKERAKQLSVYLEPAVYDQLRDIAYAERTKIHTLMLEGLDLLFRDRGARSIEDLEKRR